MNDKQRTAMIVDDLIQIVFEYNIDIIQEVRGIPERKWNGICWTVPATAWHAAHVIEVLQPLKFWIDPTITQLSDVNAPAPKIKFPDGIYKYQKDGVKFILKTNGRCIIGDEMGLGKAQPLTAKILTPSGWKLMGDLQVGDLVIHASGLYTSVEGIYDRGVMGVYQVTFSDGSETHCSEDHLWEVQTPLRKWRGAKSQVLTLREIMDRGLAHVNGNYKFFIPMLKSPDFYSSSKLPIHPYVLGALLGDGGIAHDVPVFTSADPEIISRVSELLMGGVSLKHAENYDYRISKSSGRQSDPNPLTVELRELGLMGTKSETKFIPEIYLFQSHENRLQLLRGLMDTDGWVEIGKRGNHTAFCSVSKQLADGVVLLVRSFGGVANIRRKYTSGQDVYVVGISLPSGIQPFHLLRKAKLHNISRAKYEPVRAITSIQYVGQEPVRCIKVRADDGLYITDDFIVTHNTIEALTYVHLFAGKTLVIAPASVTYKWQRECQRWLPGRHVEVIDSGKSALLPADVHVMSYGIMVSKFEELNAIPYDCVIFDESHKLKSGKAQRTRVAKNLVAAGIPHVLFLSGTPFMNRPGELFTQLNMIDPLGFKNYWNFAVRYCGAIPIKDPDSGKIQYVFPPNGTSNLDELAERMQFVMLRRTKKDVALELPDLTRSYIPMTIDNLGEYKKAKRDMQAWIKTQGKTINTEHTLSRLAVLRQLMGLGKISAALELAEDILDGENKVVLFAHHKEVVNQLVTGLQKYGVGVISGDTPIKERQPLIEKFLKDDQRLRVMVITTAGSEGIDLYAASHLIFVERSWVPAIEEQAESRLHRIGQKSPVTAWYLVAKNTIDEKFNDLVSEKRKIFGTVIRQDEITSILLEVLS